MLCLNQSTYPTGLKHCMQAVVSLSHACNKKALFSTYRWLKTNCNVVAKVAQSSKRSKHLQMQTCCSSAWTSSFLKHPAMQLPASASSASLGYGLYRFYIILYDFTWFWRFNLEVSFIAMTVSLLGSLGVGVPDRSNGCCNNAYHKTTSAEHTWWNPSYHLTKFLHRQDCKPKWIATNTNTAKVMGQPPACQIYIWSRVRGNLTIRSQAATAGFGAVKSNVEINSSYCRALLPWTYIIIPMGFPDLHLFEQVVGLEWRKYTVELHPSNL